MLTHRAQNALHTAQILGLQNYLDELMDGSFACPSLSSTGSAYHVSVDLVDGKAVYRCTCPAGEHDFPCKHKAAVYWLRVERYGWRPKIIEAPRKKR